MKIIKNPILKGFNPDPSIIRVGDDYYIATSTFEWFPGVQIHRSRDLINWELAARPLNRVSQLDMRGINASAGVWAPCLTYDNGTFYLIYTNARNVDTNSKDTPNYLVTTNDILGDWSEPIYLNSFGFDPSMFHDDDGKKYVLGMISDHRKGRNRFGGIVIQEYDHMLKKTVSEPVVIFKREVGLDEGPHIYKRNGYYYLLIADGGTGMKHSAAMYRSKNLFGGYESCPQYPILTSRENPENPLQRAGHGDIVETQSGEWYMVHLCSRPYVTGRCTLGRETGIQKMKWTDDDWFVIEDGTNTPKSEVPAPNLPAHPFPKKPARDNFDSDILDINFQSLRVPLGEDMLTLKERKGFLRLKGRESLSSKYYQSLIARRQQSFRFAASAALDFSPAHYKHMAGIVYMYDQENYIYLRVTHDEKLGKCIGIMTCDNNTYDEPLGDNIPLPAGGTVYLKIEVIDKDVKLYYALEEAQDAWKQIGDVFDASKISDEYCREGRFTGAFIGICCQDLTGFGHHADFDWFEYVENDEK